MSESYFAGNFPKILKNFLQSITKLLYFDSLDTQEVGLQIHTNKEIRLQNLRLFLAKGVEAFLCLFLHAGDFVRDNIPAGHHTDDFSLVCDGKVSNSAAGHHLPGVIHRHVHLAGHHVSGHDVTHKYVFGMLVLRENLVDEILFGHDAGKVARLVQNDQATCIGFHHFLGGSKRSIIRPSCDQVTISANKSVELLKHVYILYS